MVTVVDRPAIEYVVREAVEAELSKLFWLLIHRKHQLKIILIVTLS